MLRFIFDAAECWLERPAAPFRRTDTGTYVPVDAIRGKPRAYYATEARA